MKNKLVGVMPLYDDEKESYWMFPGYFKMLERYNTVPVMLPLTNDITTINYLFELCDGFLFTGGHDVNPKRYGQKAGDRCGECCDKRDEMEYCMLAKLADADKPVLGICRGIQIMNTAFGGTLYQDLDTEYPSEIDHHMTPPYDRPAHRVHIKNDGMLHKIIKEDTIGVNSYHHQAIKEPAACLHTEAVSEDGLIEAVSLPDKKFFLGVQWHPEFFYLKDKSCRNIIENFAASMV